MAVTAVLVAACGSVAGDPMEGGTEDEGAIADAASDATGSAAEPDPLLDAGRPERPDAAPPLPCDAGNANAVDPATGNCFSLFLTARSWNGAQTACAALGPDTHTAVIESAAENAVVFSLAGSARTWIGATDAGSEGVFVWVVTDTPFAFQPWAPGQPGGGTAEGCLEMASAGNGEWNDDECFVAKRYVCEREE
jgi:hypothetical protein